MTTETQSPDPAPVQRKYSVVYQGASEMVHLDVVGVYEDSAATVVTVKIPSPEGAQLPPLPEPVALGMDFERGWDGERAYGYTEEHMEAYARAALAAPAPQDSLDSAQPSNQVAMQAAPVALTNEQIAYSCCEIMLSEHPIDYDIAIGRAVIAEFCRVNGIPAPQTKEPKA